MSTGDELKRLFRAIAEEALASLWHPNLWRPMCQMLVGQSGATWRSQSAGTSLGRHMGPWALPTSATAARLISASSSAIASTAASHTACSLANRRTTPCANTCAHILFYCLLSPQLCILSSLAYLQDRQAQSVQVGLDFKLCLTGTELFDDLSTQ